MSKRRFQFESEGKVEYIITVKENEDNKTYTLSYSDASHWSSHVRGQKILKLVDNGNGIKMQCMDYHHDETLEGFAFEYDTFNEIQILFNFIKDYDANMMEDYKIKETLKFP